MFDRYKNINYWGEMMSEIVVVKDFEEKEYKVEIRKITYGERCRIMNEVMKVKINPVGQTQDIGMDYIKFERLVMKTSIKRIEPEVPDVMKFIDSLPVDEAKKIAGKALEINPF